MEACIRLSLWDARRVSRTWLSIPSVPAAGVAAESRAITCCQTFARTKDGDPIRVAAESRAVTCCQFRNMLKPGTSMKSQRNRERSRAARARLCRLSLAVVLVAVESRAITCCQLAGIIGMNTIERSQRNRERSRAASIVSLYSRNPPKSSQWNRERSRAAKAMQLDHESV